MIPTEDSKALVRILAFAVAKKWMSDPDELLQWAYKGVEKSCVGTSTPMQNTDNIIYEDVFTLWNDIMEGNVPKVNKITQGRKDKIKLRVREMGGWLPAKNTLVQCFHKINESDFCNGATGWVATFDWFFSNDKNWTKVMEGNYDNRRGKTDLEKMHDEIAKADAYYEQRYGKPAGPHGNTAGRGYDGPDEQ